MVTQIELEELAQEVDEEAREKHVAMGCDLQGWDCEYTLRPGGILRICGEEIDLSAATRYEARCTLRGCYAVLDDVDYRQD